MPAENPAISGFVIESVYKPAGEVGGDFYQIVATPDGGVLIVIGDVSGKGMPAAMTVSLLVSTFRTLAHYTQSPGEILRAMNQRMLTRSSGGFTTCLVLRVDPDGTLTAANAGAVSATNITGTIADAQLSTNVALLNGSPTFAGTVSANGFTGNGAGLTNVPGTPCVAIFGIWQATH